MHLAPGTTFAGSYSVERTLGKGGFATVYLAHHLGSPVALKVLERPPTGYSLELVRRFEREVRVLNQLRSPATVRLLSSGTSEDGLLYLSFEYIEGVDLAELLNERGRLEPHEVSRILDQVLTSLQEMHANGLVHRDIKPENIRVSDRGNLTIKVLDLGIARDTATDVTSLTAEGALVGTPRYMSPEQLTHKPLTPASDIYSLGVVGFELLLGSDALHGGALGDQLHRLQSGHLFAAPGTQGVHAIWRFVERMTALEPGHRYATCDAALTVLRGVASAPVLHDAKVGPRWVAPAAILASVVLVIGAVGLSTREDEAVSSLTERPRELTIVKQSDAAPPQVTASDVGTDVSATGAVDVRDSYVPVASAGCSLAKNNLKRLWDAEVMPVIRPRNAERKPRVPHPLFIFLHDDVVPPNSVLKRDANASNYVGVAPYHMHPLVVLHETRFREAWLDRDRFRPRVEEARDLAFENLCVDERRVFIIGHGQGGQAALEFECDPWVTGIALYGTGIESSPVPKPPKCAGPANPVIWTHAMDSSFVLSDGSPGCRSRSYFTPQETRDYLLKSRRCGPGGGARFAGDARCTAFDCENPVVYCEVSGGAVWPGTAQSFAAVVEHGEDCREAAADFPAFERIWSFFDDLPPLDAGP